jgi:hypothetical protein
MLCERTLIARVLSRRAFDEQVTVGQQRDEHAIQQPF